MIRAILLAAAAMLLAPEAWACANSMREAQARPQPVAERPAKPDPEVLARAAEADEETEEVEEVEDFPESDVSEELPAEPEPTVVPRS